MIVLKAKAKINLFFHITGKRPDGYHLIESLNVFAENVYDTIKINSNYYASTRVSGGEFAEDLNTNQKNLIDIAIEKFISSPSFNCHLIKNIPIGAGLGGGSSDAATILKYLKPGLNEQELSLIGADLPCCYHAEAVYCKGIGEIIEPVQNLPKIYLVLVNPRKALLTKEVFSLNRKTDTPFLLNYPKDFHNDFDKFIEFLSNLSNDLTDTATELMPEIKFIMSSLMKEKNCKIARMSGSGPTCFGIFACKKEAIQASENILKLYPEYWIKVTSI